jgi:hypothetical protein
LGLPFSIGFPYGDIGRLSSRESLLTIVKLKVKVKMIEDTAKRTENPYSKYRAIRRRLSVGCWRCVNESSGSKVDSSREPFSSELTDLYLGRNRDIDIQLKPIFVGSASSLKYPCR